ncbi:MAG: diacylglycerol kinase family lipid kinase [Bacteroidales bacterium]|jgi:YegS/Rv2252/BmrU family lipid kinase|nr:diacylglycerol kinase family lipid kinase [Bacteroidales bacterium]NLM92618.1 diacylglycerol kinase family lipid kinase [Bacteroidales bacterium]
MTQPQTKEWLVLVNPNAGIGKGKKDWGKISQLLDEQGFVYQAVFTERKLHAIELVIENITLGYRKIIVVGGDGTMNEVVNGVFSQQVVPTTAITLGMISIGTGNDWVRTYNIPLDYLQAIEIIKRGNTLEQDAGIVQYSNDNGLEKRYFANMAGLGFDGLVAKKTNADKEKGSVLPMLFLVNLLSSMFSYNSSNIRVNIDGREIKAKVFSIGVGIGQYNGGGMMQAPDARPNDGLLDLTIIKHISVLSILANIRRLYDGKIHKVKQVVLLTGKNIRIESDVIIPLEADGEYLGHSPFEFNIIPKSIKIIMNHLGETAQKSTESA